MRQTFAVYAALAFFWAACSPARAGKSEPQVVIPRTPVGLRLVEVTPGSVFDRLGLVAGDVILSINEKKIISSDAALKFFRTLPDTPGTSVRVKIKRDGKVLELDYKVQ